MSFPFSLTSSLKALALALPLLILAQGLTSCAYYDDEVRPPSEQDLADARSDIKPTRSALQEGVFHMQRIQVGSTVRLKDEIKLKKPDLPPFDVAYINRDLEEVVLELANAAGESVVIPQDLRGHTVTVVHSGANFPQMLDLVLNKAGYSYNYINGVWYITRYPIRNYVLEVGQSDRKGSLLSKEELSPEMAEGASTAGGADLDTAYSDQLWTDVKDTLSELVKTGESASVGTTTNPLNATGVTPDGQLLASGQVTNAAQSSTGLLPPPETASQPGDAKVFNTPTPAPSLLPQVTVNINAAVSGTTSTTTPGSVPVPTSTDYMGTSDDSSPWFKITQSAGMITVRASPEAHRQIEEYLEQVQSSALRQIVVEARIVALIRDKTTDRGADFSTDLSNVTNSALNKIGFYADGRITAATATGGFFTLASAGDNLNLVVQSLSTLGDVYNISTPTLVARNNQISRVSITRQLGYVETEVTQNTTSSGDITIGSRQDKAKFKNSGTVMSVMPFIGKSHVQMRFRLSVASKAGDTTIKTSIGNANEVTNLVPELANNVIDQDMVVEYGRIYAIGGLIEKNTTINGSYEPIMQAVPGLREIFHRAQNSGQDTEFLVLIKVSRG